MMPFIGAKPKIFRRKLKAEVRPEKARQRFEKGANVSWLKKLHFSKRAHG
jgi:hypothetical protein